ncbi:MAG: hypothetical protein HYX84_02525 [Chloroflexi bacterium]|nr:hypothetical protein [Chloroflexota bacterium]
MNASRLDTAFRQLRKRGYFARRNFMDCQSCAVAAIPDSKAHRYVVYHQQDAEDLRNTGQCYLAWAGDPEEIEAVFYNAGIETRWSGHINDRILMIL